MASPRLDMFQTVDLFEGRERRRVDEAGEQEAEAG